jgi:CheY-like chemotaxis protein
MSATGSNSPKCPALQSASVLVVEDQTFIRDLLERLLTSLPVAKVSAARSAEDALAMLEASPSLVHVAIVDYELPGMNGIQFIEKLRGSPHRSLSDMPIVMLTGNNDLVLYDHAARLGVSVFLVKPAGASTLKDALEEALSGRRITAPDRTGKTATPF